MNAFNFSNIALHYGCDPGFSEISRAAKFSLTKLPTNCLSVLPANCLSVFDHFLIMALKGLTGKESYSAIWEV